ncbi:MAG: acyltransferase [Lachnospiraceae bacterium]|nr:acyltransferase [Lachnospiraceae bacterium]
MRQQKRLTQVGNIRALAILLVVLGHSIILYSTGWNLYETTRQAPFLAWLKRVIDIPQMPLFFSLSGYLFVFTHRKKQGIGQLAKNKFLRLIVPYFGIGLFYLLPIRLAVSYSGYQGNSIIDFTLKFLTANDVGHLWFLPALFLIFLLSEIILSVAEHIPVLKKFPGIVLLAAGGVLYLEGYRIGLGYGPLLSAFNYLMWFALGYCLNVYQEYIRRIYSIRLVKWGLLLVNLLLLAYTLSVSSVRVLISLGLRALFIINAYGAMPEKTYSLVQRIDRNSFGIYLFHSPLIYITFSIIPNAHPAIVVFINFVIFGAAAFGLTELVRKTKLKVLIGE